MTLRRGGMAEGVAEEGYSQHSRQEAERAKGGAKAGDRTFRVTPTVASRDQAPPPDSQSVIILL